MLSKNQIAFVRSLHRKKVRKAEGLFFVEGTKLLQELLQSDLKLHSIYALPEWLGDNQEALGTAVVHSVNTKELERLSALSAPNQVLAIVHQPAFETAVLPEKGKWIVALDGISDPGNLGTIIRTANWFGIEQIVISEQGVEYTNPKVVQATMGSIFKTRVIQTDLVNYLERVKSAGEFPIYGADLNGRNPKEITSASGGVVVLGSESHGLSETCTALLTDRISIPGKGNAESLNVGIAGAILMYVLAG